MKRKPAKPESDEDSLVPKSVAARLLGVCSKTVERLVHLKKLTPVWILGALRFRLSEIRALIQEGTP
jgi:hypothetical protein